MSFIRGPLPGCTSGRATPLFLPEKILNREAPGSGFIKTARLPLLQITGFNAVKKKADSYNGFNLIFGSKEELFWFSNLKNTIEKISPGIHGLSNRFLDTPWPKVASGKRALEQVINETISSESLFSILTDQSIPDDSLLPDTGVELEWEKILSPLFIRSDTYGTRSSTVMLMDKDGHIEITERTYDLKNNLKYSDRQFSIPS